MTTVAETPEFLAWCLVHPCALRASEQLAQPLLTERSLKSLRAAGWAQREQRVFQGICVDRATAAGLAETPRGFPLAEILPMHGGAAHVAAECGHCPANVDRLDVPHDSQAWAGCFGWLAVQDSQLDLPDRLELAIQASRQQDPSFLAWASLTRPSWYGLWLSHLLEPQQSGDLADLLQLVLNPTAADESLDDDLGVLSPNRLISACRLSQRMAIPLAVELIPRGRIEGRDWWWPAHCPNCKGQRVMGRQPCPICGCAQPASPPRKRKTRGTRPFIPLHLFLGDEGQRNLLSQIAWTQRPS